jgi:para-nitrobenzyl esterase
MENRDAVVKTIYGKIQGVQRNGLYEFKGIPFAAPPIGSDRWMPPRPVKAWNKILEAVDFRPAAPQIERSTGLINLPGSDSIEEQSEDCLFLNIWTQGIDKGRRPVMVWIYGGGFMFGSGSQSTYNGAILATKGDVVVVTINHRLGLLGFLNLNEITGGKIPSSGNEGLLDQLAALKWVRENILVFGGDPENITVFGQSSGAMSIGCLLAMPEAKGLFHKAILESGTGRMARPLEVSVQTSRRFMHATGISSDDAGALRALPVEKILEIQQELTLNAPGGITPAAPVIDGRVLPGIPQDIVSSGIGVNVPIMIGNNLDELKIAYNRQPDMVNMDEETLFHSCETFMPAEQVSLAIQTYRKAGISRGKSLSPADILSAIRRDIMFRIPAVQLARAYGNNGLPAFNYIFNWESPSLNGLLGACHSLEIGFVFGNLDPIFCGTGHDVNKLSCQIQDAWVSFASTGNPSCQSLGDWPPYGQDKKTMILGPRCYVEESPYEEERKFWESLGEIRSVV